MHINPRKLQSLRLALFSLLLCFPIVVQAQPLGFLLQRVERSHPAITIEKKRWLAANEAIREAKSGYLPRVAAEMEYGYQETDRSNAVRSNGKQDASPFQTSLSVSQNLFEGFRTDSRISQAEAEQLAVGAQLESVRQQIYLQAIAAYIELLKQRHLLQLSRQNVQTLETQVALEEERLNQGTGIAVDVLLTKSRLQQSIERYTRFVGAAHEAEATFRQFFDMMPDYRVMRIPAIPSQFISSSLHSAIEIAENQHPLLLRDQYGALVAEQNRSVAKAGFYPQLDLIATSRYREDSSDDINGDVSSNAIQLRASWELFSGFGDESRVNQATHDYQSALAASQNTQRRVTESVRRAWVNMHTLRERVALMQNAASIAQEVYEARLRLRDIGNETTINVLNAENELFNAQLNALSTEFDFHRSVYEFLQTTGQLSLDMIQ